MLYTSIFTCTICDFLNSHYPGELLGYTSWMQLKDISKSFSMTFTMAVIVYMLKFIPISYWITLPIQIVVGFSLFFLLCRITKIEEYKEMMNMIKPMFNKIIGKQ
ncbi:hypothetical protein [Prevotella sp. P5-92]|uniref:hypothetical protein n=1 Tax=Prevotella sp. P5-92 TaxID=2024222 RepID=UPI0020B13CE1|nr:hypothetical protein [Prevotella sp. P5-92]